MPRLLIIGAHPDDAEFGAGGLIAKYTGAGYAVKAITVTNGNAGHYAVPPADLAKRRHAEARAAADKGGFEIEVWDNPDGQLAPTIKIRGEVIRAMRRFAPDLVLTHRANDYHPDHRATGQLVQDASYLVRVPNLYRDTPPPETRPLVACMTDFFTKPNPFQPDVTIETADQIDKVVAMLACHVSQVFENMPESRGEIGNVPQHEDERLAWLKDFYASRPRAIANRFREALVRDYGERGNTIEFAEAYEISEYGRRPTAEEIDALFLRA